MMKHITIIASGQRISSWHIIGHANEVMQYTNDASSTSKEGLMITSTTSRIIIYDCNTGAHLDDITSAIQSIVDSDSEIYLDGCHTAQSSKWIGSTSTDIAREMSKIVNCIVSGNTGFVLFPYVGWITLGDKQSYWKGIAE